ncbi:hypothetical protein D3C81_927710 [compost metagenome]
MVKSMRGNPYFRNLINVIGSPSFDDIPAAIRLALAPINEPLPPRQAPNARLHHNGSKWVIPMLPIS